MTSEINSTGWRGRLTGLLNTQGRQEEVEEPVQPVLSISRLETVKQRTLESVQHEVERERRPKPERRAWVRYRSTLEGSCRPIRADRGVQWQVRILDVSQGGLGLYLRYPVEPGTVLSLTLQSGDEEHLLVMRVVRRRETEDGGYVIGCVFAMPISNEEVGTLAVLREAMTEQTGTEFPEASALAENREKSSQLQAVSTDL